MTMSALLMGQVLLCIQMVLKAAVGPAVLAGLPMIVTIVFYQAMNKRYRRAFDDAALLQTSLLDGWDTRQPQTFEEREDFRRFLVDAHKAAYVPICIAVSTLVKPLLRAYESGNSSCTSTQQGNDKETTLTSEPALTIATAPGGVGASDSMDSLAISPVNSRIDEEHEDRRRTTTVSTQDSSRLLLHGGTRSQPGATLRRTVNVVMAASRLAQSTPTVIGENGSSESQGVPKQSPSSLLKGDFVSSVNIEEESSNAKAD